MAKTKARKRKSVSRSTQVSEHPANTGVRPVRKLTSLDNAQALLMPSLVALGSWGIAFTFTFLTTQPNHLLFGGMAALMALLWSVSLGVRAQRMMQRK